ncbi:probable 3-beta-hydroxysteroid-Delta(8),Delta(7)-isomerase [Triticum aestivum]|uniref:probable 3-beta-hydroxysteroid-Delta(8),Delta(7)-isomerase n=1 Tax=Triticum aestivum TaxID=4565 RepID=UPI001D011823|nr:probable 3-beta-hydroxysteroid-Delta(8),Delta(7)-isomerase [Triticum aestivum]
MSAHPYAPAGLDLTGYVPLRLSQLPRCLPLFPPLRLAHLRYSPVKPLSSQPHPFSHLPLQILVLLVAGRYGRISKADHVLLCWWAFTGLTHILIEGPFVFTPNFFAKGSPNYFDEVSMLSHLGGPTTISSSLLYVWVSSMDARSTSLLPTWMASTSGPVHSSSGHISSARTVHGS